MAKGNKDYFGLTWIVSLILAIIPVTSWVLGFITRFKEGHWICGILRVIPCFGFIIWIVDLFMMIFTHHIWRIA